MINVFNNNYEEIGSLNKNLVLQTQGRVKIRYGKKFIDLLDNNGNINVPNSDIIKKVDSIDKIHNNGIYVVDSNVYVKIGNELITLVGTESGQISYKEEQDLTSDEIKTAQKNIGLRFNSLQEASQKVQNGIVFVNDNIYYIDNGNYKLLSLITPLSDINLLDLGTPPENAVIKYFNGNWNYYVDQHNYDNSSYDDYSDESSSSSNHAPIQILRDYEVFCELESTENPMIFNIIYYATKSDISERLSTVSLSFSGDLSYTLSPNISYVEDQGDFLNCVQQLTIQEEYSGNSKNLTIRAQAGDSEPVIIDFREFVESNE